MLFHAINDTILLYVYSNFDSPESTSSVLCSKYLGWVEQGKRQLSSPLIVQITQGAKKSQRFCREKMVVVNIQVTHG